MAIDITSLNSLSTSCHGEDDGSTFVTAGGGTAPYTYDWDDGQTTDTAYNLVAGDYIVTVTDASGCTATDTATIFEPDLITGKDSISACDSYTWIDGTTYTASNNTATHTLNAANGCDSVVSLDLTIITSPTVDLGNDVAICQGDSTLLDAGSGHTNYLWNTGETTQTIYADTAGTYSVTVGNGTNVTNNNSLFFDGNGDLVKFSNNINTLISSEMTILLTTVPDAQSYNEGKWIYGQDFDGNDWFGLRYDHEYSDNGFGDSNYIIRRYNSSVGYDVKLSFRLNTGTANYIAYTHSQNGNANIFNNGKLVG